MAALAASHFATDADRWRAVQMRDVSADGHFLYGVRTTRIYCRPNCKARLARRANVVFFGGGTAIETAIQAAEAAGFRACKRCKPRTTGVMPEEEAVQRIRRLLEAAGRTRPASSGRTGTTETTETSKNRTRTNCRAGDDAAGSRGTNSSSSHGADPTIACSPSALALQAGVSRWHFHRKFKQVTGVTPLGYLRRQQAQQAQQEENDRGRGAGDGTPAQPGTATIGASSLLSSADMGGQQSSDSHLCGEAERWQQLDFQGLFSCYADAGMPESTESSILDGINLPADDVDFLAMTADEFDQYLGTALSGPLQATEEHIS